MTEKAVTKRYYQAQLDVSLLEPGSKDFNLLSDSCFILIAPFDLFGYGLYRYTFEGTCRECPDLKIRGNPCLYQYKRGKRTGIFPGVSGFYGIHNRIHRRSGQ